MNDNPKWQPFLDKLPESLHAVVKPVLAEWDKGVQEKIQSVRSEYAPYQNLVDAGIDPGQIEQALTVADMVRNNPTVLIDRVNTFHNLGYVTPDQAEQQAAQRQQSDDDPYDTYGDDNMNLEDHPKFKAMQEALEATQSQQQTLLQRQQQEAAEAEFEDGMAALEAKYKDQGGFDRTFVTAYIANGWDPDQAVEQYRNFVTGLLHPEQQQTQEQAPQAINGVLNSQGQAGSGVGNEAIDFGAMSEKDVKAQVTAILEAQLQQG
jgi:hypothetical protein